MVCFGVGMKGIEVILDLGTYSVSSWSCRWCIGKDLFFWTIGVSEKR